MVPGSALSTVTSVTWLWATVHQPHCTKVNTKTKPPSVPNGSVTLTRAFTLTGIPQAAMLYLAADDVATVSVNGTPVSLTLPMSTTATTHNANYKVVHTATVTTDLYQGSNTITITAENTGNPTSGLTGTPNPAGVGLYLPITWTTGTANLCKKTGWRKWTTAPGPFQNQGDCVSYFVKNPSGADPTIPNTAKS